MELFLTDKERLDLIDALEEWAEVVGPKELDASEIGLNSERYEALMNKLQGEHHA